jgi:hypothetical protein
VILDLLDACELAQLNLGHVSGVTKLPSTSVLVLAVDVDQHLCRHHPVQEVSHHHALHRVIQLVVVTHSFGHYFGYGVLVHFVILRVLFVGGRSQQLFVRYVEARETLHEALQFLDQRVLLRVAEDYHAVESLRN